MPLFISTSDPANQRRQMAEALLRQLGASLPAVLDACLPALLGGQEPEIVLAEAGRLIARAMAQQQQDTTRMESRLYASQGENRLLRSQNDRLQNEPVRQQLQAAQDQVQALTLRLEDTEADLHTTRLALASEQRARRQETAAFEAQSTAQNRIIAQQQLRLNSLLGEPSGANTSGGAA